MNTDYLNKSPFLDLGDVVPVGGTREGNQGHQALIHGDMWLEPMSNMPVKVGGAFLSDGEVVPSAGGHQTLLDANTLACEARALDSLRQYKDSVTGEGHVTEYCGLLSDAISPYD